MAPTRLALVLLASVLAVSPARGLDATHTQRIVSTADPTSQPARVVRRPRDLSSLLVRWTWKGSPDAVVISGGVGYVRSSGRLVALQAGDGTVIWDRNLGGTDCSVGAGPVVLGNELVVGFAEKLFVLDPATGDVRQTVTFNGNVSQILMPPLTVVTDGNDGTVEILRVDPHLGQPTARRSVGQIVFDAFIKDGFLVLNVDEGGGLDDQTVIIGLGADDLVERWRIPVHAFPRFERVGEQFFLQLVLGEKSQFSAIEPRTGTFGRALPPRLPCAVSSSDLPWDLEITKESDDRSHSSFRRNSFENGQPVWTVDLPCAPGATLKRDHELLIDCGRGVGRSTLITLDWSIGHLLRQSAGLRDVRRLQSYGDLVIAETFDDGVVAFDANHLGPPEGKLRSLRNEVHRILAIKSGDDSPIGRGDHIGNTVADLQALGPDALTHITNEIPSLGTTSLVGAAHVLGHAHYRKAAARLAARLQGPLEEPGEGWDHWNPQFAVLTALAKIGGREEVPLVASILMDPQRKGSIRRQALATLASIGTSEASAAIGQIFRSSPRKPVSWWSPPSPQEFARFVGLPDVKQRAEKAQQSQDAEDCRRLLRASESTRVARPDGMFLLIFPDSYLGGPGDLWIAEADATGTTKGSARFTGISIHGQGLVRSQEIAISAELNGDALTIHDGNGKKYQVSMKALDLDSDGDGLPDIVEQRLRTDPKSADTDGDGVKDSEDLAPNARLQKANSEEQAITLEIFRQFFMFEPPHATRELAIMVTDAALKWTGRAGPTISLGEDGDKRFLEEAGYDGIPHIRIKPLGPKAKKGEDDEDRFDPYHVEGELRPDERPYKLDLYRGGLNAIGYRVVVRKIGSRWVIADVQVAYVS